MLCLLLLALEAVPVTATPSATCKGPETVSYEDGSLIPGEILV